MLELHQFTPVWGILNGSPFCMKLETYLKLARMPYKVSFENSPRQAPKGKLPYIKDGDFVLGDSGLVISYLKKKYGDPLDSWLDEDQVAVMHAYRRMIEDHLILVMIYSRWADEAGWHVVRKDFFAHLPNPLRMFMPHLVRWRMQKWMFGHGVLRHSRSEIYDFGREDFASVVTYLGTKKFFMGDRPSTIDATLYSFLCNILRTPVPSPLKDFSNQHPTLQAYLKNMDAYLKSLT